MPQPPDQMNNNKPPKKTARAWRTVIEVGFIVFLFYSNLLMGEYTHSCRGQNNGLWWAIRDIFTLPNFIIAIIAALVGHLAFGYARKKL
jgi:hypothetical protein